MGAPKRVLVQRCTAGVRVAARTDVEVEARRSELVVRGIDEEDVGVVRAREVEVAERMERFFVVEKALLSPTDGFAHVLGMFAGGKTQLETPLLVLKTSRLSRSNRPVQRASNPSTTASAISHACVPCS